MSDPRAKARKLIALALASKNETESRNAAVAACALIQRHKLLGSDENDAPRQGFAPSPRRERPSHNPFEDFLRAVADDGFFSEAVRQSRVKPPPQPRVEPAPSRKPKRDSAAKLIPVTDLATFCHECRQPIRRGQYATWLYGKLYHPACYDASTEP